MVDTQSQVDIVLIHVVTLFMGLKCWKSFDWIVPRQHNIQYIYFITAMMIKQMSEFEGT